MSAAREKEALECIGRAEKHLKTSIWALKTKPEYELAAYEYDRAAVCYRNSALWANCVEMHLKSADCHKNSKNVFHEAKSKEQAAMAAKDGGDLEQATALFEESAQLYCDANSWDTAAQTIDKAGKILEQIDDDKAIRLYKKGLQIVVEADRTKTVLSLSHRMLGLYLKKRDYGNAIKISQQLIQTYKDIEEPGKIGQLGLGLVIISLLQGDSVDARKNLGYLSDGDSTSFTGEMQAAKALIVRFGKGDNSGLQEVLRSGIIRSMDNAYLRIVKELKAPTGGELGGADDEDDEDLR